MLPLKGLRVWMSKPVVMGCTTFCTVTFAAFFTASLGAQSAPPGWKAIQVRYTNQIPDIWEKAAKAAGPPGSCEISVPPDWKTMQLPDGGVSASAPDSTFMHPFDAEVHADVPGPTFAQQVQVVKQNDKDSHVQRETVIEDSAAHYWTAQKPSPGITQWDVTVPGRPNCHATVHFPEKAGNDVTAKKVVASLRPAK